MDELFDYEDYYLDNGLRVALCRTPTRTFSAALRVYHGAVHEDRPSEAGLAHFMEHCLVNAGSSLFSPAEVVALRATLAGSNASTSLDLMDFTAASYVEDLDSYLSFVSSVVSFPLYDPVIVERERGRVLREIAQKRSGQLYEGNELFTDALRRDHPSSISLIGSADVVASATVDDVEAFRRRGFAPSNMELVLVGGLPVGIENTVYSYFGSLPLESLTADRFVFPEPSPLEAGTIIRYPGPNLYNPEDPSSSHLMFSLAFLTASDEHEDAHALRQLSALLGGASPSARLFRAISRERGLAYFVQAVFSGTHNFGSLDISSEVAASTFDEVLDLVFDEFARIQEESVSADELSLLQKNICFQNEGRIETNAGLCGLIGSNFYSNDTLADFLAKVSLVTPADIQRVAQQYLPTRDGNYVLIARDPFATETTVENF